MQQFVVIIGVFLPIKLAFMVIVLAALHCDMIDLSRSLINFLVKLIYTSVYLCLIKGNLHTQTYILIYIYL